MIKLIAMDMDGTLLKKDNTIDEMTKATLLQLQRQGVRLVLASGRSYTKLLPYAKELNMGEYGGYLIEINGLALYELQSMKRTVKEQLGFQDVKDIFTFAYEDQLEMQALFDDGMFIHIPQCRMEEKIRYRKEHQLPDDFPWTRGALRFLHDNRQGYPKQTYISSIDEISCGINKVCYVAEKDEIDSFAAKLKEHFQDRFWMGKTTETWLEIMPKGITKGDALMELAKRLHIKPQEIMAFGDGENDIEMLQKAGYGIAMGNALENVKAIAYAVTDDHQHAGIAKALKKYILEA